MLAEDLDTWPNIIGTERGESELRIVKDWNMDKDREEREISDN